MILNKSGKMKNIKWRHIYKKYKYVIYKYLHTYIDISLCISYQFVVKWGKYTTKKIKIKTKKVERKKKE